MPRIIKNFAQSVVASVTAAQATAAKKSTIDHKAALEKLIGKNLEKMEPGDGMVLPLPKVEGINGAKYLAQLRGKFVPATREGEVFAGRVYKLKVQKATDDKPEAVLLWREDDLAAPKGKKVGGRKPGTPNKPKAEAGETVVAAGQTDTTAPNISEAKAAAQAHLGTTEQTTPKVEPEVAKAKKGGAVKDLTAAKKDVTTA